MIDDDTNTHVLVPLNKDEVDMKTRKWIVSLSTSTGKYHANDGMTLLT
jgi:hypothetical protein